ncbi:translation initiation factor IF-2-like [Vulpes lagopus]|uniref:translation initiation factor IF-2-like n=1 Tax=Vulpes lagopus TaxID=494514 RepID=UPI001BCA1FD8|nr:translation initiation factor IF-2-like [Vulpes lagopus]
MGLRGPGPPSAAAAAATELRAARGRRPASDERRRGAGHARRAASRRAPLTDGRAGQWARAQQWGYRGRPMGTHAAREPARPPRRTAQARPQRPGKPGAERGRRGAAGGWPRVEVAAGRRPGWRAGAGRGRGGALPAHGAARRPRVAPRTPPRRGAPTCPRGPAPTAQYTRSECGSGKREPPVAGELRGRLSGRWRSSPAVGVRVAGKARLSGNKQAGGLPRRALRGRAQARGAPHAAAARVSLKPSVAPRGGAGAPHGCVSAASLHVVTRPATKSRVMPRSTGVRRASRLGQTQGQKRAGAYAGAHLE